MKTAKRKRFTGLEKYSLDINLKKIAEIQVKEIYHTIGGLTKVRDFTCADFSARKLLGEPSVSFLRRQMCFTPER